MSETVMMKGRLKLLREWNREVTAKDFLAEDGQTHLDDWGSYVAAVNALYSGKFYADPETELVYEVIVDKSVDEYSPIFNGAFDGNDVEFLVKFHDGGMCLSEALGAAFEDAISKV